MPRALPMGERLLSDTYRVWLDVSENGATFSLGIVPRRNVDFTPTPSVVR